MANNPHVSTASRNLGLDAAFDVLNSGYFRVYDGTQPANANTALSGNTKLAENTFGSPAFGAAASGSKTANAIGNATILATSTATWCTMIKTAGVRGTDTVMDVSAGTSGADVNFNSVAFVISATCSITSLVVSQAA